MRHTLYCLQMKPWLSGPRERQGSHWVHSQLRLLPAQRHHLHLFSGEEMTLGLLLGRVFLCLFFFICRGRTLQKKHFDIEILANAETLLKTGTSCTGFAPGRQASNSRWKGQFILVTPFVSIFWGRIISLFVWKLPWLYKRCLYWKRF